MSTLAYDAMMFAREVHAGQVRKYTGNPYTDHLAEVAGIVAVTKLTPQAPEVPIAVAWLHDCMEDCAVTLDTLEQRFGSLVAHGVFMLSDMEQGNRAERKAASRKRLSEAHGWMQSIKCADLISNTSSIVMHDPKFAKVYLEEKWQLLEVLTRADSRLRELAWNQVIDGARDA